MTSILLNDYVEQVDKLIDSERLVEAIEHCRHIMHSYPRHIDTYRMLGKALLEKKEYDAATDIFLRILGADPNDFISHVGLSIVYKEESQSDQALWHLERAYEIKPYNVAIQGELRQLYAVQTETRLGIIPLTRGALARLYMQGELYQQAIAELRRVLAEEPSRMGLQVLLAEALWRDGQRIDAEEVCLSILEEIPNCIVLNAILAEIWLQTGRIPEAQKYLQRLQGLTQKTKKTVDKESIPGRAFALDGAFPLPEETSLEFLQTGSPEPIETSEPSKEWAESVSFDEVITDADSLDQVVLEPESGMHSYDWLADIENLEDAEETAVSSEVPSETDWFSQDKAKEALNLSTGELNAEWLAGLRGEEDESSFKPQDKPQELEGAVDGEADEEAKEDPAETDWFADDDDDDDEISDEDIAEFTVETGEMGDDVGDSVAEEETAEDSHDWLEQLADNDSALEIDATNLMTNNLLDWDEVEADEPEEEEEEEAHVVEEPNTPYWLSEMADQELEAVQLNPEEALDFIDEPEAEIDLSNGVEEATVEEIAAGTPTESKLESGPTSVLDPEDQADLPESGDLDGADDWLAALTEGTIDEEIDWDEEPPAEDAVSDLQVEASTDELAALGESDDWLQSAASDFDAIMEMAEFEEDEFPNLAIPELEGNDITDIPDWLDMKDQDELKELEATVSSENDPQEAPLPEKPDVDPTEAQEEDGQDWLDDLSSTTDKDIPVEPPIETEGMPSWLADAQENESPLEIVDEWESASADIPDWLQEPINLADLDDEEVVEAKEDDATSGLTGLLSEMDVSEEALGLDQMDSLFADWAEDEDQSDGELTDLLSGFESEDKSDGELTDLLGGFEIDEDEAGLDDMLPDSLDEASDLSETIVEPEEGVGLTGLLSKLAIEEEDEEETAVSDDDFFLDLDLLAEPDEDRDEPEAEPEIQLSDLDANEDISLTELLSDVGLEEETVPSQDEFDDGDDWLADLTNLTDEETEPVDAADDPEEEVGLTGMLANILPDEETADSPAEQADVPQDVKGSAVDELGLTELLAGIDYEEDAVQSDPVFADFDNDPIEPSLTEILTEIEDEPASEADEGPISAEDTTWLNQLEADTGSLQEQQEQDDEFDLAEESGLDWLTTPDEPEVEEEVTQPEGEAEAETAEPVEADGTAEDWGDAMSWLDDLAAQQDEPIEELPSVAETMLDEELDTVDKLAVTAPMDDDEGLDWLDDLTSSDGDTASDDDLSSLETIEDILDEETKPELPETRVMAEEDTLADLDDLAEADEISWLDELATDNLDVSVVEEAETAIEPDEELLESLFEDESVVEETAASTSSEQAVADDLVDSVDEPIVEGLDPDHEIIAEELEAIADIDDDSWLDAIMEETADDEPEDAGLPEELTNIDEAATEPHVVVAGVTDALKMDSGIEEAEADLEEALAWLDELDEEETTDEISEAPETVVDLPVEEAEAEELEAEDVPETIIVTPEPDELTLALDRLEQTILSEGISVPNTAVIPLTLSSDELTAALDWIVEEETVADEPVVEDDLVAEADDDLDLEDMSDDPEAWLEQMLNEELDMDIEMAPPPIKPSEDALFVTSEAQEDEDVIPDLPESTEAVQEETPVDALLDDVELEGLPDDPDAAVAWLDQMVSDEDKTEEVDLDVLTELTESEATPVEGGDDSQFDLDLDEPEADISLDDLSDDPEAMLAQLLSDDLDIEMEPPAIKPSEDAVYVTGEDDSSSDADDVTPIPELETESDLVLDTPVDESAAAESDTIAADIIADVPDDPDEAMAWLEQLAAQQEADIDELPSITDVEDDLETAVSPDAPIDIEETTPDEDVTSELPDWLGAGDEDEEDVVVGATDWLQSLPEVDMETWLSAEEDATVAGTVEEVVIPDTGPLSAPPQTPSVEELDDDLFEPVLEPSTGAYSVDEAQLTVARDALANGRLDEAITQFKQLVTAGSGMMTIIAELEQAAGANPQKPAFHQVLGDAYMRNGQLQKALASYRSALDQM